MRQQTAEHREAARRIWGHFADPKLHSLMEAVPAPYVYPGDFLGQPHLEYRPHPDELPDPGEVVWAWVPYEEDFEIGKDRPVLVVGHDGPWLLGLMLTSKDHDRDKEEEASHGRYWVDIGTGPWDQRGRSSEARVDRVIRLDPRHIRRPQGFKIEPHVFERVAAGVFQHRR
ncbi:MAG: type II toxin-antitoxin system PemK/MazF family toxin [Propionibacteriaceae bacterium]|nr:type II toxin-antitoxin system PemK/MazF family toxin [Propionibacteriaceae bacterium]